MCEMVWTYGVVLGWTCTHRRDVRLSRTQCWLALTWSSPSQVCVIAAAMTSRSPFVSPLEKRAEADAAKASFGGMRSDPLAVLAAYRGWEAARAQVRRGRERKREGGGGGDAAKASKV